MHFSCIPGWAWPPSTGKQIKANKTCTCPILRQLKGFFSEKIQHPAAPLDRPRISRAKKL